jgi:hypothetical protein
MDYQLLCPDCKKEPSQGNLLFIPPRSFRRMDVPYFMCSDCRIIYVDKEKIKQYVRWWKKLAFIKRHLPSNKVLYKMALEQAEDTVDYYVARVGYHRARFIRKPLTTAQ